jgi:hypothetical protein
MHFLESIICIKSLVKILSKFRERSINIFLILLSETQLLNEIQLWYLCKTWWGVLRSKEGSGC